MGTSQAHILHTRNTSWASSYTLSPSHESVARKSSESWSGRSDDSRAVFQEGSKTLEADGNDEVERLLKDNDRQEDHEEPPREFERAQAEEKPVTWWSLPRKDQLFLLMLARTSEPLTQTSLQSYMYYQIKSFNPSQPDSSIATQVGWMQASFTLAQFMTAFLWGRIADSPKIGRKWALVCGLLGTIVSALGFGFSRSFAMAMFFRMVGGALNGNVGIMRTMISEIVREKKYQSRAFMMLPMTANVAVIIGPSIGGFLAEPVKSHPLLFGKDSVFGGKDGIQWMSTFPYALPNIFSAGFLLFAALSLLFGLEDTHYMRQYKRDYFRDAGRWFIRFVCRRRQKHKYMSLEEQDLSDDVQPPAEIELESRFERKQDPVKAQRVLPFRRIWTRNVVLTLATHGLLAFHVGTFNNLWFTFLSTPRFDPQDPQPPTAKQQLPFSFTGGFAMPPSQIGLSLTIIGTVGITLQLLLYPRMQARFGTVKCYRFALTLFPLTYFLAPYLCLIPSTAGPQTYAAGFLVWLGIGGLLFIQVLARTFALPGAAILVNNCCPHPSVLGAIHGLGQSVSSGTRTLGPLIGGYLFGKGLMIGIVGLPWWAFSAEAVAGRLSATFIREGNGHEVLLEGEEDGEPILNVEARRDTGRP